MLDLKNKNVLVTGATGFVGAHLVKELVNQKAKVIGVDISTDPQRYFFSEKLDKKTRLIKADIRNLKKMREIISEYSIDYIFHLAAVALVDEAYDEPLKTYTTNIIGTVNLLECARQSSKIKAIIVASSDKAYGKLIKKKYKETDPLKGDHPYEASKSSADLIATSYFKTYDLPVVITRFGNIYGEGDLNFSRIIPAIMRSLMTHEVLELRSNGKYVRDYLYVKDVINGYLLLAKNIEKMKGEAFNFGSEESLSVIDLIKLIEKTLKVKVNYKILNTAKNEIPYQSLDYSKIKKTLNWSPRVTLKLSLNKIYKWYKSITL